MKYDLINQSRATRIFYDGAPMREIRVLAGQTVEGIELSDLAVKRLAADDDLIVETHDPNRPSRDAPQRPALVLDGRFGIGDAIHQRGVLRELIVDHDVWLHTCHYRIYEDLVARGLKLIFKDTRLHAQAKTIAREKDLFPHAPAPPANAPRFNLSYNKELIDKHGSILEAMAGCVGVKARPLDFSLPVRPEWTKAFRERFAWNTGGKPLMVYRPVVQRREWNGANRNPDPQAYSAIFRAIRDKFFVVSIADLAAEREWIVGPEEEADLKLHKGELTFEDMAALWSSAAIVFCNAGFAPVLAQAVGTPSIIVYGGREDFQTTQRAGEHLAPTLGLDADQPCACHSERHNCGSKAISLAPAIGRAHDFIDLIRGQAQGADGGQPQGVGGAQANARPAQAEILVFATTYVDSGDRERLTRQWLDLHSALNPECDFLLVDSNSPKPVLDPEWAAKFKAEPQRFKLFDFGDNVGHLSRQGRDGWGRAFCRGLDYAVEHGYPYVLHIEGDSLLRIPARELVAKMKDAGREVASIPVKGTARDIPGWVETGLMLFSTAFLRRTGFTARYDWPKREVRPTPEFVVLELLGRINVMMLPINGLRGDKNQISAANIGRLDLDWVTHCHNDIFVYDQFVQNNYPKDVFPKRGGNQERAANIAVIIGGARNVWDEIGQTAALACEAGAKTSFFVVNDMIPLFPGPCVAISLHPQKLKDWLVRRTRAGWAKPDQVWAHVKHDDATHFIDDWRGSSGLFAVRVARHLGFEKIILCGVPMNPQGGHVVRGAAPWKAAEQFLGGWKQHAKEIAPYVRSWSGWTGETFGQPDPVFLAAKQTEDVA